ncbi:MAG: hypothetical protein ACRDCE_18865 [Cetobacterium sp.]|uniref:hypothetical protein n=1 Tax=Cetobacterium sp. TaxID=2071632 RepID=UPI003EE6DFF8
MELIHAISQDGIRYCGDYGADDDIGLSEGQKRVLESIGAIKVIGWYGYGSYEGSGEALIVFNDGTLSLENLGHCSCYGPWDNVEDIKGRPAEVVRKSVTDNPEYWEQIGHFFDHVDTKVEY